VTRNRRQRGVGALIHVIQLGPVLVLAVLCVVMSFASPYFLTEINITNLLQASVVVAVLAIGQLLVILTGGIDLSSGAVVVLTGVVGAKFAHSVTDNGLLTVLVMLSLGGFVGLINGILIEKVRLGSSFVITLGVFSVAQGAAYVISGGATITGMPTLVRDVGGGYVGQIPTAALVALGAGVFAYLMTSRMTWGRWIYAVGGNRDAASRVGMPVKAVSISVFVFSGIAAGLGGVFATGLTDAGAPTSGFSTALDAIAAVIIGGTALTGGRGTVWGALVGALILGTIHNALNLLNVDTNWEPIVLGIVLILAVGMDQARGALETRLRLVEARSAGGP
jgi:ribose/xylose/arabinose/galactoside ABC-type transport system permease subunit